MVVMADENNDIKTNNYVGGNISGGNVASRDIHIHNYTSPPSSPSSEERNVNIANADLLPYLPDRVDQELELGKKIKSHQAVQVPFICVIHGKQEECNDGFIKRIYNYSLNTIIPKQVQQGIKRHNFSCDSFNNATELHTKMWASLGEVVAKDRFATPNEIAQVIAQENCPVLLCVAMSSDDCLHNKGIQSIEFFLDFWKEWPASTEQRHLLLVCFSFNYTQVNSVFGLFSGANKINKVVSNYLSQQLDFKKFNLAGVVLPELTSVEYRHVDEWARLHLNPYYEKVQPKIRELFKTQKAISMETLALKLEEMLETVK
jgi:hypothetical protein